MYIKLGEVHYCPLVTTTLVQGIEVYWPVVK